MEFNEQVWSLCKRVPKGRVTTYGEIARAMGTKGYQAVGIVLNKNPYGAGTTSGDAIVPCHRVVMSDGSMGGFAQGVEAKIKLLTSEGVEVVGNKVSLEKYLFRLS